MFSCSDHGYLNFALKFIFRVLSDKTRNQHQKNVARILRLIVTHQYQRLKNAFKKYKVDINMYFHPGFFYSQYEVDDYYLSFSWHMTTFFEYAYKTGSNFMTMKTLIDLGVDLMQPNYEVYKYMTLAYKNNIHWFLENMELSSFCVAENKDWKLLDYMVNKNKMCLDLNSIGHIQEAICDPKNPKRLKKHYSKYLKFFVEKKFFLLSDWNIDDIWYWMPKLTEDNDNFTYTAAYYESLIF